MDQASWWPHLPLIILMEISRPEICIKHRNPKQRIPVATITVEYFVSKFWATFLRAQNTLESMFMQNFPWNAHEETAVQETFWLRGWIAGQAESPLENIQPNPNTASSICMSAKWHIDKHCTQALWVSAKQTKSVGRSFLYSHFGVYKSWMSLTIFNFVQ